MAGEARKSRIQTGSSDFYEYRYSCPGYVLKFLTDGKSIISIKVEKDLSCDAGGGWRDRPVPENMKNLTERIKKGFDSYFRGEISSFELPVADREGTGFQKKVWKCLKAIPYGKTVSYRQLAGMAGNPLAARAAAGACRANPFAVIVPCHRVIATDGSIGGYSGKERLTGFKKMLLELEGAVIHGQNGDIYRGL